MRELFHYMGMFVSGDAVPWLRFLDIGGHGKAMKKQYAKVLDNIVLEWFEEHRQSRTKGGDEQDFIDAMLSVLYGQENIIAGGSDTTIILMVCALSLLFDNRQALNKVQEELDNYVGKRKISE
ncbi:hypothetical protein ACFX13_016626 [Malus domestica]